MHSLINYDYDYLLTKWLWLQFSIVIKYDYMTKVFTYDYNETGDLYLIMC